MSFDLAAFARDCGVSEPEKFAARCETLRQMLEEANRTTNLTRIVGETDFAVKHAADSLMIGKVFPELAVRPLRIADVGCGAGFPSLILALAYPQLRITAIDSTGKKIAFVADAAEKLGLDNLAAVHGRANELDRQDAFRRRFDVVTARAVAPAASIVRDCRHFPAPGGRFLLYQSPDRAETDRAEVKGMTCRITPAFDLPEDAGKRCFLEIFPGK